MGRLGKGAQFGFMVSSEDTRKQQSEFTVDTIQKVLKVDILVVHWVGDSRTFLDKRREVHGFRMA